MTSSRDIPRILDTSTREVAGGAGGRGGRRRWRLRTGSLRTSSRRSLAASLRTRMLAYAIPYGPRTQPAKRNFARALLIQQKRATDVQIRRNWILTSALPTYPSMRRETVQAYAAVHIRNKRCECNASSQLARTNAKSRANGFAISIRRKRRNESCTDERNALYFSLPSKST